MNLYANDASESSTRSPPKLFVTSTDRSNNCGTHLSSTPLSPATLSEVGGAEDIYVETAPTASLSFIDSKISNDPLVQAPTDPITPSALQNPPAVIQIAVHPSRNSPLGATNARFFVAVES